LHVIENTFLLLSCPFDVPFYLSSLFELENGEKSSSISIFAIYPCYEKSNFVSFEGGVGRVLEGVRSQQDALE
jgi:hypothetical protein